MRFSCACPACGYLMHIPQDESGGEVQCAACGEPFIATMSPAGASGVARGKPTRRPVPSPAPVSSREEGTGDVGEGGATERKDGGAGGGMSSGVPGSGGPAPSGGRPGLHGGGAVQRRSPPPPSFKLGVVTEVTCPACGAVNSAHAARCHACRNLLLGARPVRVPVKRPLMVTLLGIQQGLSAFLALSALVALRSQAGLLQGLPLPFSMAWIYVGLLAIAGVCGVLAVGLWKLKSWARLAQLLESIPGLLVFPVGTLVSAVVLLYLARPEVKILFSGDPGDLPRGRREALERRWQGGTFSTGVVGLMVLFTGLMAVSVPAGAIYAYMTVRAGVARQRETVESMNALAKVLEQFKEARGAYPEVEDVAGLVRELESFSGEALSDRDGWGRTYHFERLEGGRGYRLVSFGADGRPGEIHPEGRSKDMVWLADLASDIVVQNGRFRRWPARVELPPDAVGLPEETVRELLNQAGAGADSDTGGPSEAPTPGPASRVVKLSELRKFYGRPLSIYLKDGTVVQAIPRKVNAREIMVDQYFDSGAMTFPIPLESVVRIETIPAR